MGLPPDKKRHLITGILLALILVVVLGFPAGLADGQRGFIAALAFIFLTVVIAGVGKELMDRSDPERHTAETWDAVATITGGLLILFPALWLALKAINWP